MMLSEDVQGATIGKKRMKLMLPKRCLKLDKCLLHTCSLYSSATTETKLLQSKQRLERLVLVIIES